MIFDLHCDTLSALWSQRARGEIASLAENELQIDLAKLRAGGVGAQLFAVFVDAQKQPNDAWESACAQISLYRSLLARHGELCPILRAADLCTARESGRIAAMLTLEDAGVTKGDLSRVRTLYEHGVRALTLTWNHPNTLAAPNNITRGAANTADKLRPAGIAVLEACEQMGIAVDLSHLSDGGAWDVLARATKPPFVSHSGARAVCSHVRNLPDALIAAIGEAGGVVGLCFYDRFLAGDRPATMADVVAHAKHILNVGGADVLAIGSDFDGIPRSAAVPDAAALPHLTAALEASGFHAREIEQITSGNATRYFQTVLR